MEHRHKIFLLLAVGWVAGITALSLIPPSRVPKVSFRHLDKVAHFIFYFVFFILWYCVFSKGKPLVAIQGKAMFFAFLFAVVYGTVIEVLQYIMPYGRSGDINDILANTAGIICGIFTVILIRALNKTTKRRN